jgi:hypothetical protein
MNPWKVFFFCLFSTSLIADSIKFSDGKILEDVKIIVKKEVVEIRYKDGKSEIRNKNEFKNSKIKIIPVAWFNNNTSENSVSLHEGRQARINQQMYILEQQREANFALSQKVVEERKRHDSLMKERIRLQYTEGLLTYAGEQSIYTEIMEKNGNRYYVRNQSGLLYFTLKDFGDEMIIETDKGKEKIDISKVLAVKEEKYKNGFIYLASGEKFKGSIVKRLGDQAVLNTPKGEIKLTASEILFPNIPIEKKDKIKLNLKEGDYASFLFENGDTVKGKMVKVSKNFILIDTEYGTIEMDLNTLESLQRRHLKNEFLN